MDNEKSERPNVLVLGGGIAGITASLELLKIGVLPHLVEKTPFLGGHSSSFACKATDQCLHCNVCLMEDLLKELNGISGFPLYLNSSIVDIKRNGDGFKTIIESEPLIIDQERCKNCGICFDVCPVKGEALIRAPSHLSKPLFYINKRHCSCIRDGIEPICKKNCPESAINFENKSRKIEDSYQAVIISTGYRAFDPSIIRRFNYEKMENMMTALELEQVLRFNGGPIRPSDGIQPESIAFVQCVGSRSSKINRNYCSRVCCGYALRMATRIAHDTDTEVTIFYMDFQDHTKGFLELKGLAKRYGVRFLRTMPGEFYETDEKDILVRYYDDRKSQGVSEVFSMMVLSVGISPSGMDEDMLKALGLEYDEDGFLKNVRSPADGGVALAGTVLGPMDIAESISSAKRAVFEIKNFLRL